VDMAVAAAALASLSGLQSAHICLRTLANRSRSPVSGTASWDPSMKGETGCRRCTDATGTCERLEPSGLAAAPHCRLDQPFAAARASRLMTF
jgi:hypothetical protein